MKTPNAKRKRPIGGIVLCGGNSTRMGTPKELLPWHGRPLLVHVVEIVSRQVDTIVVSARPGQALPPLPPQVTVIADPIPNEGPLIGLEAAMDALHTRCRAAVVVACDHPLIRPTFLQRLIDLLGDHQAIVPMHDGQRFPLIAVYAMRTRTTLTQLIAEGVRSVQRFAEACPARFVDSSFFRDVDPQLASLRNVNQPSDLAGTLDEE